MLFLWAVGSGGEMALCGVCGCGRVGDMRKRFNSTVTARIKWAMTVLVLLPLIAQAQDWREETRNLLEAGKKEAAFYVLQRTVAETRNRADSVEKVNRLRFVGEFYCKADECARGAEYFAKALNSALAINEVWKRLSAVISVLELQQYTIQDQAIREPLLKQTLDAKLLPEIAKDHHATEIGRYVKRFDGADRKTVAVLLDQIRRIPQEPVRTKALFAMSEITFGPDRGDFMSIVQQPAGDAQPLEQLLWHVAMARLFDSPATSSNSRSHAMKARQLMERVPEKYREKVRGLVQ